jgi:SAM-dependent methyltransferase
MASEQVQIELTGCSGSALLEQTSAFVRSVAHNYCRFSGRTLDGASMLDFGCGYGRIARLMYYFSDPPNVVGVDPWDKAIQICHADGLGPNFLQSDYLPKDLPLGERHFDLIYSFSVFTHLSERATRTAFQALLAHLAPDGIIAITIRPLEYWNVDVLAKIHKVIDEQISIHRSTGFAFLPHHREPIDGDITYGDTSMSLEWLGIHFPEIEILGIDRSLRDPYQVYVFARLRATNGSKH